MTNKQYEKAVDKINAAVAELCATDPDVENIWNAVSDIWADHEESIYDNFIED